MPNTMIVNLILTIVNECDSMTTNQDRIIDIMMTHREMTRDHISMINIGTNRNETNSHIRHLGAIIMIIDIHNLHHHHHNPNIVIRNNQVVNRIRKKFVWRIFRYQLPQQPSGKNTSYDRQDISGPHAPVLRGVHQFDFPNTRYTSNGPKLL